jgi:YfiH family protein
VSRDTVSTLSSSSEALVPDGWLGIEGLVCGFGHRRALPPRSTVLIERQVHGTVVLDAPSDASGLHSDPGDGLARVVAEADALVAASPGLVAGVRTADCVPLLLVAPRRRWAVAVHAGWRGTVGGIAGEAVKAAVGAGIRPEELFAALGPSIGPCCYEVSEDLGERFGSAGLPVHSSGGGTWALRSVGKPHLDLRAANRVLLERAGVPAAQVQAVGPCTRCARDLFHSFRAEPESAGRQVSWVGWVDRAGRV